MAAPGRTAWRHGGSRGRSHGTRGQHVILAERPTNRAADLTCPVPVLAGTKEPGNDADIAR